MSAPQGPPARVDGHLRWPGAPSREPARRRTVADRLLGSYVLVLLAFAITVGWSFLALRAAARDAEVLRAGYVPLLLRIGEVLAEQNVFNAQLNHITAAKNAADVREWIETARRTRPLTFSLVRQAAERRLPSDVEPSVRRFRDGAVRAPLPGALAGRPRGGRAGARRPGQARGRGGAAAAGHARSSRGGDGQPHGGGAPARGALGAAAGRAGAAHAAGRPDDLDLPASRARAAHGGHGARAKVVARGDLTPHDVVATNDEIGELATTFEGMVEAIARARAELVQAERLATIGKMAAHITHEIRNPLSSIGLNVELLEEEVAGGSNKEAQGLVQAVKSEVDRTTLSAISPPLGMASRALRIRLMSACRS